MLRLYPPFGYSVLYKEYYLTGFNHQKTRLRSARCWQNDSGAQVAREAARGLPRKIVSPDCRSGNSGYLPNRNPHLSPTSLYREREREIVFRFYYRDPDEQATP